MSTKKTSVSWVGVLMHFRKEMKSCWCLQLLVVQAEAERSLRDGSLLFQKLRPAAGLSEIHAQAAVLRPHAAERKLQCARGLSELSHLHCSSRYVLALIISAACADVFVYHQSPSVPLRNQIQAESSRRNPGLL